MSYTSSRDPQRPGLSRPRRLGSVPYKGLVDLGRIKGGYDKTTDTQTLPRRTTPPTSSPRQTYPVSRQEGRAVSRRDLCPESCPEGNGDVKVVDDFTHRAPEAPYLTTRTETRRVRHQCRRPTFKPTAGVGGTPCQDRVDLVSRTRGSPSPHRRKTSPALTGEVNDSQPGPPRRHPTVDEGGTHRRGGDISVDTTPVGPGPLVQSTCLSTRPPT